jgi:medium-chain acyl-[acyl-carrier-protein] hydrolase
VTPIPLVCFPNAGRTAAALYARWRPLVPAWIRLVPVELPGRGARSHEPPIGSMPALVETLLPEILALGDRPLALFGHSVGAKIGFEIARRLAERGREPLHLFVAASPWDRYPAWGKDLHQRPRDELVAEVRRLGGAPPRLLDDARLVDLLLPVLRADFQLAVEYQAPPGPLLGCPITAFAGTLDPDIALGDVAGWASHTRGAFRLAPLDAGHHFVRERAADLVGEIAAALTPKRSRP